MSDQPLRLALSHARRELFDSEYQRWASSLHRLLRDAGARPPLTAEAARLAADRARTIAGNVQLDDARLGRCWRAAARDLEAWAAHQP